MHYCRSIMTVKERKQQMVSNKILAIDLGTGNSAMAIFEGGEAKIIPNSEGGRTTPSIIGWTKTGERLVGQAAKRQAVTNPKGTVYEVKRLIGRKYDEVLNDIKMLSYDVVKAANGDCRIKVDDKEYSPEECSSFILAKLKKDAEAYLGDEIKDAIITVPAYFNDSQRQATKDAGTIAGLNVLRIINEPTAASLAYGVDKTKNNCTVAIADSGSGTLDFSILELGDGVFEVKATNGDSQLGGKDYDQAVMKWLISEFKVDTGIDLTNDNMAVQRLKDEAEKAKIALSTTEQIEINIPFISADETGPKHLVKTLTRAKLEALIADLNDRYDAPAKQCIVDAGDPKIDEVILVGGTTRMPSVQKKIADIFGIEPSKSVNPDEAVALGAAIQGAVLRGEKSDILLLDVTPLTLSIETMGGIATPMIDRNTTIPAKKTQVFSTASDNQSAVTVRICQGERKMFNDNKVLGTFNLDGIPPAPRGVPQIEITYDIDANGILNVSAKDLGTQKEQHITITSSSGLSDAEIEKAKADAEKYKAEDEKRATLIQEKNLAEGAAYASEKSANDNKDKLGAELSKKILDAVAAVREVLKGDDVDAIRSKVAELTKVNEEAAKVLYPNGQQGAPNFSAEDIEKMKNDPKFASFFKDGGPFAGGMNNNANSQPPTGTSQDGPVDAEVVD
jgi:molecular chaperone DnaK